jgi:hypothetical protein
MSKSVEELKADLIRLERESKRLKINVECLRRAKEIYEFLDSHRRMKP